MLVSICFQIQILIGIVSCITRNGISFLRKIQYIFRVLKILMEEKLFQNTL